MTSEESRSEGRPMLGVALVALAVLAFALADTTTKELTTRYPVPVIVFIRYSVNALLLALLLWPRMREGLWQTTRTWLVMIRGLILALASLTMALALTVMPVGEATAIIYLAPFAVMLLAGRLLGEKVGLIGWAGAMIGFFGVLLIVRPGGGLDPLGVTYALINAGLATAYHLMTRFLSRTEQPTPMVFHSAWIGAVLFGVLSLGSFSGLSISFADFGLMVLLGTLMTIGHFLFTVAYREGPASMLAPVNYLHLVWAGGLGWLVFGHVPEPLALFGMGLVTVAGVVIASRAHLGLRRGIAR